MPAMRVALFDILKCSLPLLIDISQPLVTLIGQRLETSFGLALGLTARGKQLLLAHRDRSGQGFEELKRGLAGECTAELPCHQRRQECCTRGGDRRGEDPLP